MALESSAAAIFKGVEGRASDEFYLEPNDVLEIVCAAQSQEVESCTASDDLLSFYGSVSAQKLLAGDIINHQTYLDLYNKYVMPHPTNVNEVIAKEYKERIEKNEIVNNMQVQKGKES